MWLRWLVLVAPFLLVAGFSVLLAAPASRDAGMWLLRENRPVEIATFLALLAAGLLSLSLSWSSWRSGGTRITLLFYFLFGAGLILVGMEEIAWGQYWLGFETPSTLAQLNVKGEATLHNIGGIDGRTEILRVVFGVGGLVGVWLNHAGRLSSITPPTVLWTWFAMISGLSAYDLMNDVSPLVPQLDTLISWLDELVELMIGLSALLFVALKRHEIPAGVSSAPGD